jgi:hypothetical protein
MALPQDGQNANGLTKVTEIPKGKELIFIDPTTNEGGIITLEDLTTQILKNLTSQTFALDQGNMTLLAALNQLNSKALRAINNEVNDWNSISQQGIYSGNGNAVNSPITGAAVWIDAIVMASNGNISYLNLLAVSTTGILLCRRMSKGTWENWNIIK